MNDIGASPSDDRALVSDGAPADRHPSGFDPSRVIRHIASAAHAIGWQAGVGGMETAGSIVSFLARNPERIPAFMETGSVLDWPSRWHVEGCLTWHGASGGVFSPDDVRLRDSDRNPEGGDGTAPSRRDESAGRRHRPGPVAGDQS